MDISPDFVIKQENVEIDDSDFSLGFDVKIKVEKASPQTAEDIDWCVDNEDLFNNNSYVNLYDDFIEYCKHECMICHTQFADLYSLYEHNVCHLRVILQPCHDNPHQCKHCNIYFQTGAKLKAHKLLCSKSCDVKAGTKEFQCYVCAKVMPYKSWYPHVREVHNVDKAICKICNKKFKCHRYLRRHMIYKHEDRSPCWKVNSDVQCQRCPAILKNKHALKTHMNNCHSNSEFTCGICRAIFKSKPYLRTHIERVHDKDGKKYTCVCRKSYSSPRRLRRHKQRSGCDTL